MRYIAALVFALALTVLAGFAYPTRATYSGDTGSIVGHVLFEGQAQPEGVVISDAVVYLVGEGLAEAPVPEGTPVLNQLDITFTPHVITVVAGTEMEITNSDGITHNVKTKSRENRRFNRAQLADMRMTVSFDQPEVITVVCNIHSQMSAYIVVVPNAFFARVAEDGTYSLTGVPAGEYQLVAWHEAYGQKITDIVVESGGSVEAVVDFGG